MSSKTDELHRIASMMNANLIDAVAELNKIIGIKEDADPTTTPLIYILDGDYNNAYLLQRSADGHGTRTIFGYTTQRALYELIKLYSAQLE